MTDMSYTALIVACLIKNKTKGLAKESDFHETKKYKPHNFIDQKPFENKLHDNRSLKEHAI